MKSSLRAALQGIMKPLVKMLSIKATVFTVETSMWPQADEATLREEGWAEVTGMPAKG